MEKFDRLKIQMEDILSATDNFSRDKYIGAGGFGPVYKGKLSLPIGPTMVAFKRLDRRSDQGNTEFLKEIMLLSECKHENIVSLLRFCNDGAERVLVYEYASRGSLDQYLSDPSLTWNQRLHICIGVARGLKYLHDPMKPQGRIIHRDIKSSNILLDEKWTAKVSDFGLSKVSPTNKAHTVMVSTPVGTIGYCDPLYWEMGFLSKESDVYSFGVVLLEVMCGRLCSEYRNGELIGILVHNWKKCCDEKKLDDIIFQDLKSQMHRDSLITFATIASRCLRRDRGERPTMDQIVKDLQIALEQNVNHGIDLAMISNIDSYKSQKELLSLLSKGILVDEGKRWISVNKNEEIQEMISATQCIREWDLKRCIVHNSRFSSVLTHLSLFDIKVEVKTKFLLPHLTYTINLVFKQDMKEYGTHVPLGYKLEEETHYSKSCIVQVREDGWLMAELFQFTSQQKEHEFKIMFKLISAKSHTRYYEGIEFRPIDHEIHKNLEDKDSQQISNWDMNWEQKLSQYHVDLLKLSKDRVEWTTKKELYFLLRKGFLIDKCENMSSCLWLSLSKNLKKRLMVPASAILIQKDWIWKSQLGSRFGVVAQFPQGHTFSVNSRIKAELLSPMTNYGCHLIYKLPKDYSFLDDLTEICSMRFSSYGRYTYLAPPRPTPVIKTMIDQNYGSQPHTPKVKGHPNLRKDDWIELLLCEISTTTIENSGKVIEMKFQLLGRYLTKFDGIVIQGIEFRPL